MLVAGRLLCGFLLFLTGSAARTQAQAETNYRLVGERCDVSQWLFLDLAAEAGGLDDYMVGTARVTGTYRTVAREGQTGAPLTYPALTVMTAPDFFLETFTELVARGNTVNHLDDRGQLVLALSFRGLDEQAAQIFEQVTSRRRLQLTLFKPPPTERGLPDCGSLFEILHVEDVDRQYLGNSG